MRSGRIVCFFMAALWMLPAVAQLTSQDIAALQGQAKARGWTFSVKENEATRQSTSQLCGLSVPEGWRNGASFNPFGEKADLPAAFNWRTQNGCTPIKSQGGCGSCWAFATIGPLECNIKIRDGVTVSLSEQWLISCNQETELPHVLGGSWGCNGGWWAHDYHTGTKQDSCGGSGAVLSANCPYMTNNWSCLCPYRHDYAIDSWAFVGEPEGIPSTDAVKQAILTYGPISAAVYVDDVFKAYDNGVFNASNLQEVNHGIVLVGWDDTQGAAGVWILRNSWGNDWGEDGYMRIEYGCSNVGYGACYVDYAGRGNGIGPTILGQPPDAAVPQGWQHLFKVEAQGIGTLHYEWRHDGDIVGNDAPALAIQGVSQKDEGTYSCTVSDVRGTSVSRSAELRVDMTRSVPAPGVLVPAAILLLFGTRALRNGGKDSVTPWGGSSDV